MNVRVAAISENGDGLAVNEVSDVSGFVVFAGAIVACIAYGVGKLGGDASMNAGREVCVGV